MISTSKWRFGFATSALLLLWTIVFLFVLSYHMSMGPAFFLLYLTVGVFILMMVLMLLLVFFRRTRSISFGLAIPLLVVHIEVLLLSGAGWYLDNPQWLVIYAPSVVAFLIVGILYLTRNRPAGGQPRAVESYIG